MIRWLTFDFTWTAEQLARMKARKAAAQARERRRQEWLAACRQHRESAPAHKAYVWAKAAELAAELEGQG